MMEPNLIQNFPAHLISGYGLDVCFEVQYPKQTSSQLMSFLRRNGKGEFIAQLTNIIRHIYSTEWFLKPRTQFRQIDFKPAPSPKMEVAMPASSPLKEPGVQAPVMQEPVFKLKCVAGDGQVYSCVIVSSTDLWDLSNVCIGDATEALPQVSDTLSNTYYSGQPFCFPDTPQCSEDEESLEESLGSMEDCIDNGLCASLFIPPFQFRKFVELRVAVAHVVDPSNFYIQHKDTEEDFMSAMESSNTISLNTPINWVPDIGSFAVGWFPEQQRWYRVMVTKICGMNRGVGNVTTGYGSLESIDVEVQRVDFGDTARLSLRDLREMSEEIAAYPAQALQVSLANVRPLYGSGWSTMAVSWFKDLVKDRTMYARLYPQDNTSTMVELFMERGKIGAMRRGVPVSVRLAQNGHAHHSQLKSVSLKRSPAEELSRKQAAAWDKYLLSCYAQNKKWKHSFSHE